MHSGLPGSGNEVYSVLAAVFHTSPGVSQPAPAPPAPVAPPLPIVPPVPGVPPRPVVPPVPGATLPLPSQASSEHTVTRVASDRIARGLPIEQSVSRSSAKTSHLASIDPTVGASHHDSGGRLDLYDEFTAMPVWKDRVRVRWEGGDLWVV